MAAECLVNYDAARRLIASPETSSSPGRRCRCLLARALLPGLWLRGHCDAAVVRLLSAARLVVRRHIVPANKASVFRRNLLH